MAKKGNFECGRCLCLCLTLIMRLRNIVNTAFGGPRMTIEQRGGILLIGIMYAIILSAFGYTMSQYTVIAASAPAVGVYLADGLGRPLYCLCDGAPDGCNDSCMSAFFEFSGRIYAAPPLNQSDFSYVPGSQIGHISYRGAPLYYFRGDTRDGIYGDGYIGVWRLARP